MQLKLTTVLTTILLATTTHSFPFDFKLAPRTKSTSTPKNTFEITSFRNGGSPHSLIATLSFTISDPSTNLNATNCYYTQSIQPSIATTPFGTPCTTFSDPSQPAAKSIFFGFQYYTGLPGYWLTIAHVYNGNKTVDVGSLWLGDEVATYMDPFNPNGNYQYLNFSQNFDVGYNCYSE